MTRALPPRPDIKHLRKEAKQLYIRLHRQAPEAQLADAQFILAAEYGFKSWGKLKSEVDRRNADRWAARLAEQESFAPFRAEAAKPQRPSHQHLWLSRQDELTADDFDIAPAVFLQSAAFQLAILLLALSLAFLSFG
jgi:hypothetical protein